MQAATCNDAAVHTGLSGLCGTTPTCCASASAAIFFIAVIPPTTHTSGRT